MSNLTDFSSFGYRLIKILGQNQHQGRITYLAGKLAGEHRVVIKQFQFARSSLSWTVRDALTREIKILQQLEHPRIPRYIDSFEDDGSFYLIQEYKDAPSLAEVKLFTPAQVKTITISVLEILVYLQDKIPTVIHRDIKPANILVDLENNAYLVDFGFSRIGGDEVTGSSVSSVVRGTPGFMPPEQLWGRLTKASDLYSLGMTTICLLCGIDSSNICHIFGNSRLAKYDRCDRRSNRRRFDYQSDSFALSLSKTTF
ncbi:serine/threonine protein kinase [Pleurocapsales cyanobacterium LEGE 10410]|nr:serine/threonine protein kinase [Pleurocapsales cyanobacterium LEGE 10410]